MFQSLIGICVSCNSDQRRIGERKWKEQVSIPNRDLCKLQPGQVLGTAFAGNLFQSLIGICVSCNGIIRGALPTDGVSIPNRDLCKLQPLWGGRGSRIFLLFQSLIGICVSCNYSSSCIFAGGLKGFNP
mgnify:FL=1